jgi:hypothetical protein
VLRGEPVVAAPDRRVAGIRDPALAPQVYQRRYWPAAAAPVDVPDAPPWLATSAGTAGSPAEEESWRPAADGQAAVWSEAGQPVLSAAQRWLEEPDDSPALRGDFHVAAEPVYGLPFRGSVFGLAFLARVSHSAEACASH